MKERAPNENKMPMATPATGSEKAGAAVSTTNERNRQANVEGKSRSLAPENRDEIKVEHASFQ